MMHTAGITLGSLLMLAFFLLVLQSGYQPHPIESAADAETPIQPGTDRPPASPSVVEAHDDDGVVAPATIAAVAAAPDPGSGLGDGRGFADTNAPQVVDPLALDPAAVSGDTGAAHDSAPLPRYPVWTPFRSQWAAAGFARRLTRATDVPIEVVDGAAGDYQVVFSYRDQEQRETLIRQIEAVTGLELQP